MTARTTEGDEKVAADPTPLRCHCGHVEWQHRRPFWFYEWIWQNVPRIIEWQRPCLGSFQGKTARCTCRSWRPR